MGSDERGHVPAYPGPSDHCGYCGRMCIVGEVCPAMVERAHCEAVAREVPVTMGRGGGNPWCEDGHCGCGYMDCEGKARLSRLVDLIARERAAAWLQGRNAGLDAAKRAFDDLERKENRERAAAYWEWYWDTSDITDDEAKDRIAAELDAAEQRGLERAAKAICPSCSRGDAVEDGWHSYHPPNVGYRHVECTAWPALRLRLLGSTGGGR